MWYKTFLGNYSDTPILEAIWPLDCTWPVPAGEAIRLHHAKGSACRMDDFLPMTTELGPKQRLRLGPQGGRSSIDLQKSLVPPRPLEVWYKIFLGNYNDVSMTPTFAEPPWQRMASAALAHLMVLNYEQRCWCAGDKRKQ